MSESPLLELHGVCKQFGDSGVAHVSVLRGVDLTVRAGETIAVVGASGCGKSTLLNIIGTLDQPEEGSVRLAGEELTKLNEAGRARVRSREIGFVFQMHHLLPHCSALENVLVPTLAAAGLPRQEKPEARARRLLERVGLADRLDHRPGQLSGGERQRVAVVRALINEPRLLLADEPTGSLDEASAEVLGRLLLDLNAEEGVALIVVTHSLRLAAGMQRQITLSGGRLADREPTR
jgi:lipoprotein-releasing system ATP-binding protein